MSSKVDKLFEVEESLVHHDRLEPGLHGLNGFEPSRILSWANFSSMMELFTTPTSSTMPSKAGLEMYLTARIKAAPAPMNRNGKAAGVKPITL